MLLQHGAWLDDGTATHPLAGQRLYNITMATSKQGGVFGFIHGKVGSVSYSVLSSKTSSSGKREQVVRSLPQSVSNPQTMGQVMQRMKLAPAQKFYAAFADLLSNAFEGVAYGEASRRYFISKAMSATGPYIEKGVDRFIPAQYVFSEGTLPSVGIEAFSGGASVITLSATTTVAADAITPAIFAAALNVSADTQITIVVVNNVNGVFTPSYIGYDQRVKIEDLPASIFGKDADNHITLNPAAVNLSASAIVACCVVLSKQDASGNWLRSTQKMVISNELVASLYGSEALKRATLSYQNNQTANAINSEWYYNLGMSQAFNGTVHLGAVNSIGTENNGRPYLVLMGDQQIDGVVITTLFTVDGTASSQLIGVSGSETVLQTLASGQPCIPDDNVMGSQNYRYAQYNPTIATQAGFNDGVDMPEPTPTPTTRIAKYRELEVAGDYFNLAVDEQGHCLYKQNGEDRIVIVYESNPISVTLEDLWRKTTRQDLEEAMTEIGTNWGWTAIDITVEGEQPSGNGSFTLPATEELEAKTYTVVNAQINEELEEYA